MKLAGKRIVVTGGASGIGRELVRKFLELKATVAALDIDTKALYCLKKDLANDNLKTYSCDLAKQVELNSTINELGSQEIDIWINNAGVANNGYFLEVSPSEFERVIEVNLTALIRCSRAVLKIMQAQGGGLIVNVASVAGHVPAPLMTSYVASKHGVVGFTRALSAELDLLKSPVKVMLVSPGFVNTTMVRKGEDLGFPLWLDWLLAKPESIADDIVRAIEREQRECAPGVSGKLMLLSYQFLPMKTVKASKILLTKKPSDVWRLLWKT